MFTGPNHTELFRILSNLDAKNHWPSPFYSIPLQNVIYQFKRLRYSKMQLWNFQLKFSDYLGFFHLIYQPPCFWRGAFQCLLPECFVFNNYNSLKGVKSKVTLVISGIDIFLNKKDSTWVWKTCSQNLEDSFSTKKTSLIPLLRLFILKYFKGSHISAIWLMAASKRESTRCRAKVFFIISKVRFFSKNTVGQFFFPHPSLSPTPCPPYWPYTQISCNILPVKIEAVTVFLI